MFVGYYKLFINNKVETDPFDGSDLTFVDHKQAQYYIDAKVKANLINLKEDVVEVQYFERYIV